MVNDYIERALPEVRAIQERMIADSLPAFSKDDVANLTVIVRLVVEFKEYCAEADTHAGTRDDIEYVTGSILSGVEFFHYLSFSYGSLRGVPESRVEWPRGDFAQFRQDYLSSYEEFDSEEKFERKCRLLLDLFKKQIVFFGIFHP